MAREAATAEPMAPLMQSLADSNLVQSGSNDGWELLLRALEMDPEHPTINHYYGNGSRKRGLLRMGNTTP